MAELEAVRFSVLLQWLGVLCYVVASVALVIGALWGKPGALRRGMGAALAGAVPHGAGLALRWLAAGHGPYMARHEVLSSNAWVALAVFLVLAWRKPALRPAGCVVVPAVLLMLAASQFLDPGIRRLPPSLRSVWLVFHVLFAKLAAGGLLLALGAGALGALKERSGGPSGALGRLPPAEELDMLSHRLAGFGFAFWTVMIAAGAIWANESWGRYWAWDPIETWSLVTWLLIGGHLHLRRFFGWRGSRSAWSLAACFVVSLFTLFGVPFVVGSLHGEYFR